MKLLFLARLQAESLQFYQKYCPLQIFYKVSLRFLAIYCEFLFGNFYFWEHLSVAAVNRCKVFKIFISKIAVYIQGQRPWSEKS